VRRKIIILTGSTTLVLALVLALVIGVGAQTNSPSRAIDAIVSTEWLETNIDTSNLVILDVRNPAEYAAGHIPGAINSPEGDWYINDPIPPFFSCFNPSGPDFPCMELPTEEDLFATIGNAGITGDSLVVIVSRTVDSAFGPGLYAVAGATRVAVTLIYAGIRNVAILDGGYDKWANEGRVVSTDSVTPTPVTYEGEVNEAMFVSMDYVQKVVNRSWWIKLLARSVIVDARDADVYFGVTNEPWAAYPGHIPGATSLPAPWLWNAGVNYTTYKDAAVLGAMAAGVVTKYFAPREIIVYCGVGGYASTDYFVLSEVLGYENVKIYDGSDQEWTQAGNLVVRYEWQ
jgi:thiosulfate/3-mercaptopyruvate sulfurtransferase